MIIPCQGPLPRELSRDADKAPNFAPELYASAPRLLPERWRESRRILRRRRARLRRAAISWRSCEPSHPASRSSAAVAIAAVLATPVIAPRVSDPGHGDRAYHRHRAQPGRGAPAFQPGLTFCVKKLLRWAVALLGLRIALGDIVGARLRHRRRWSSSR